MYLALLDLQRNAVESSCGAEVARQALGLDSERRSLRAPEIG
jgi:hypothetical protein